MLKTVKKTDLESGIYELIDGIAVVSINNPPINAISAAVRRTVIEAIDIAEQDSADIVLIYCEGDTYIAGADITEFDQTQQWPELPDVMRKIESHRAPVVVAMHRNALGGGLELALAADYRCATEDTKLGLPEVNLGLLPGSGGTQRLPRLIGVKESLSMILNGKPISANDALNHKLIDQVITAPVRQSALTYCLELRDKKASIRPTSNLCNPSAEAAWFTEARENIGRQNRLLAPGYIIDLIEISTRLPFEDGLRLERERFLECRSSPGSLAMRHMFFAERQASKPQGIASTVAARPIANVAVIGAGTMGCGITMCFATAGYSVTLVELNEKNLSRGMELIRANYQKGIKRGSITEAVANMALTKLDGTTSYHEVPNADLVIEATFESMPVKQDVFRQLDNICKPGCILATNTSYLDINDIAKATQRPSDVIGAHFFSPAHIMKLLEVVKTPHVSDDVVKTLIEVGRKIGKIPVTVGVCYGFVGNRMLQKYARQAQLLLIEGATPQQIDKAIKQWGMAMGPLSVADLAGLDIGYHSRRNQGIAEGSLPECSLADELVAENRLGRKTGCGFYQYDSATGEQSQDPTICERIKSHAKRWGIEQRSICDSEIVDRLILALVKEGLLILKEGIATRSSDIDTIYVNGYGFPRWRGGPMFYAQTQGHDNICARMQSFFELTGDDFWDPTEILGHTL